MRRFRKLTLSYGPSITDSLWTYNYDLLVSILAGMYEMPIVSGVKIEDDKGNVVVRNGVNVDQQGRLRLFDKTGQPINADVNPGLFEEIFEYRFPIESRGVKGENRVIGRCTVYSSVHAVFRRVKFGFLLIIINSVIKTVALWAIFLFFSRRLLGKPLGSMARQIRRVNLDNWEQTAVTVETKGRNELKILEASFNTMLRRVEQDAYRIKTAHARLEEAERSYREIFENAVEGIFRMSEQYTLNHANPSMARLFGYASPDQMAADIDHVGERLFSRGEQFYGLMETLEKHGQISDREVLLMRRNGEHFWGSVSIRRVVDAQSGLQAYDGMMLDISDRKKRQAAEWARRAAENSAREKSDFLAKISHELRTPLIAISGFSELLRDCVDGERELSYLKGIIAASKGLTSLTTDIIDLTRIDAGKITIEPKPMSIDDLCKDLEYFFKLPIQDKKLSWYVETDENVPVLIEMDESRLRQVLLNLIGNSVKYTDSGYVKLSVDWSPQKNGTVGELAISVEDSGIGIEEAIRPIIFDDFVQQGGMDHSSRKGFGLGLAVSRRLVELMDGTISVESERGKGSCFRVIFSKVPVVPSATAGFGKSAGSDKNRPGEPAGSAAGNSRDLPEQSENQLPPHLHQELLERLDVMSSAVYMPDIRQFVARVKRLARQFDMRPYTDYAERLEVLEKTFDIAAIETLVCELHDLMSKQGQEEE